MSRWHGYFLFMVLLLALTGCSTVPFRSTELVDSTPTTSAALVAQLWSSASGKYLVRQSALFEFQGGRTAIEGVMKLDLDKKLGRLVAMNELGVKLFDLAVDRTGSEALFVLPELAAYPGFTEAVATSVRRIFLAPEPHRDDTLTLERQRYRLSRSTGGKDFSFIIGGHEAQLLEKSCVSEQEQWQVRYYEYSREQQLLPFPRGIVLDDQLAGYRLTLWLESVDKSDE
jgi:hypothetical protein